MRILALAVMLISGSVAAAELSDTEAKQQAMRMEKTVAKARDGLNQLIEHGERHRYRTVVRDRVQFALDAWPQMNLDNRAIFPYFACKQAAVSMLQYGDAWARNDQSKIWRDYVTKNFRQDYKECRQSLVKPDMSLKAIDNTGAGGSTWDSIK